MVATKTDMRRGQKTNGHKRNGQAKSPAARLHRASPQHRRDRALRTGKMIALGSLLTVSVLALIGGAGLLWLASHPQEKRQAQNYLRRHPVRREIEKLPDTMRDAATRVKKWAA